MEELNDKFHYVFSSSLNHRLQIKIGTLEGKRKKPEFTRLIAEPLLKYSGLYQEDCADLMVQCQVYNKSFPLALPVTTSYKAFTSRWNWNEWLQLPVYFNDVPRTAQLALTIYDCVGPNKLTPVGGTTISLFSKRGLFRQGMMDLRVWPNKEADGSYPSTTPGKIKDHGREQMQRLAKLAKKHRNGHITKVDWLDRLTFRELEVINEKEKRSSDYLYLMIEFPSVYISGIPHHVVYFEQDGDEVYQFRAQADVVTVPDHEILKENLVESKHHKLARSLRIIGSDREFKPNAAARDMINAILSYPPTRQLSNEEQDQVWKFRFHLCSEKKALIKFLKCVNWTQSGEVRQALSMMGQWAAMDVEDALELLTPSFSHPVVRRYAISRLAVAPEEDLMLYLLQLVQALKYENFEDIKEGYKRICNKGTIVINEEKKEGLEKTQSKDSDNMLANSNVCDQSDEINIGCILDSAINNSQHTNANTNSDTTDTLQSTFRDEEEVQDLSSFLIRKCSRNSTLANYLYWYLLIECEDQEQTVKQDAATREMYLTVLKTFSQTLLKGTPEMQRRRDILGRQQKFIDKLVKLIKTVNREGGHRNKKASRLQQLLADSDIFKFDFTNFEPIPLPLHPEVEVKGIIPEKANLFKSAMMPFKLVFKTIDDAEYVAIFKYGDDLRQDQLVLQMITLMDKLLQKENLDLKLTPYRVLATSCKHGFVQFINSVTVAEAVTNSGGILSFLRTFNPQENGPFGIVPEVIDTYVRSCAGYCVVTYLLGVGDRHLDNLLITTSGNLFHIDFSYILGRDPKPLPPPMKLSREMVEAMGGNNSEYYQAFRKQSYTAFLHLRRHANLILNLFSLLVDASVPDIALEPDKAVKKIQDKLRLDLTDEEAVQYLEYLISCSGSAVMPVLVEQFHKFSQYWRN